MSAIRERTFLFRNSQIRILYDEKRSHPWTVIYKKPNAEPTHFYADSEAWACYIAQKIMQEPSS